MDGRKLSKKIQRKRCLLKESLPDWNFEFSEYPTKYLLVCNGGISNGVGQQLLSSLLGVTDISLPHDRDFSFVTCPTVEDSIEVLHAYNGHCAQTLVRERGLEHLIPHTILQGPPLHLLIMYLTKIPLAAVTDIGMTSLPPGCHVLANFVTEEEETRLIKYFGTDTDTTTVITDTDTTKSDSSTVITTSDTKPDTNVVVSDTATAATNTAVNLKLRKVHHYGYEFLYGPNTVDPECPLEKGIPRVCEPLLERVKATGLVNYEFDQLTVNEYKPGAGIPPHIDTHSAFKDGIISLSLSSHIVMQFSHPVTDMKVDVLLPRRSLLVLTRQARYVWSHGIIPRKIDPVYPDMPGYTDLFDKPIGPHVLNRQTRLSLTFRKIHCSPCDCDYPKHCDNHYSKS